MEAKMKKIIFWTLSPDFKGALTKTLSLLKVGVLGCMVMDVASPNWTILGWRDLPWLF
jgi:hypothetical protein